MAKMCDVCNKGVMSGNNVSHSNRKSRTFWAPNVQKVKVVAPNGAVKSLYVCTRCMRSGKVTRAI